MEASIQHPVIPLSFVWDFRKIAQPDVVRIESLADAAKVLCWTQGPRLFGKAQLECKHFDIKMVNEALSVAPSPSVFLDVFEALQLRSSLDGFSSGDFFGKLVGQN